MRTQLFPLARREPMPLVVVTPAMQRERERDRRRARLEAARRDKKRHN